VERGDRSARQQWKLALVRSLYDRGLDKRRVRLLFNTIDWIMTLSPPREFDFLQEVSKTEEKQAVPFISPADVASLNTFLAAYGKLPDIALTVVIHTGSKPVTDALGGEQKMPYDWSVEIYRRGWGTPNDPRQTEKEPGYVVSVHVWLSDAITLKNLEIPKHIDDVRSAGEIEQFIGKHRRGEV